LGAEKILKLQKKKTKLLCCVCFKERNFARKEIRMNVMFA